MERDQIIVSGVRERNEKAFGMLVDDYGALIRSIVRRHLKNTMYEDECVNDILLSLWQNMDSYDSGKNSLKNWIGAVCKYKCIDYLRRHYRDSRMCPLTEDIPAEEPEDLAGLADELLSGLKPDDRRLFRQHYIEGISVAEIAREQGKSPGLLYNRLSLGRKRLKNLFKERTL